MNKSTALLNKIEAGNYDLERDDILALLSITDKDELQKLFDAAYKVKTEQVGRKVYLRGLVELSNICEKDCYYCGIRRSNKNLDRYLLTEEKIVDAAVWAQKNKYGSVVLQSGERKDDCFTDFICKVLAKIKDATNGELGITISLGEQSEMTYRKWFSAGAHRYLLRIETSNRELYKKLHPDDHSFDERLNCLKLIKKSGYQLGTGVMMGLPGQTLENLADDIIFFREIGADMIGMGPYIPHADTPLAEESDALNNIKEAQLDLGLKMIAITRIYLQDVNIAATTALQALKHDGRELGLKAGANVIMPNLTETKYRSKYKLYDNKPCMDENASMCRDCLKTRVESIGEKIAYGEWGDPLHFFNSLGKSLNK